MKKSNSISNLKKQAQLVFNLFIRKRDQLPNGKWKCISCGKIIDKCNAGHYCNTKHYEHLRYTEDNCHAQCIKCNLYLRGNIIEYRLNLINKIGENRLKKLENKALNENLRKHKWTKDELIAIIEKYS